MSSKKLDSDKQIAQLTKDLRSLEDYALGLKKFEVELMTRVQDLQDNLAGLQDAEIVVEDESHTWKLEVAYVTWDVKVKATGDHDDTYVIDSRCSSRPKAIECLERGLHRTRYHNQRGNK